MLSVKKVIINYFLFIFLNNCHFISPHPNTMYQVRTELAQNQKKKHTLPVSKKKQGMMNLDRKKQKM